MGDERPGRGSFLIDPELAVRLLLAALVVAIYYRFYASGP